MGRAYDGKRRWNETVLRGNAAAAPAAPPASGRAKKTKRLSGRTTKLSKAMRHVDEETRAIVRNARLDALEVDNYGLDAPDADPDGNASDDNYVDGDPNAADTSSAAPASAMKDKKARKSRKSTPKVSTAAKRWKVKSLAQLVFEEFGTNDTATTATATTHPNYLSVAAAPSTLPPRRFCVICGFFAPYTCVRCGSRFCRIQCGNQHKESGCLKFGL